MTPKQYERMVAIRDHYRTEHENPLDDLEGVIEDAERFLCDGTGANCVTLMAEIIRLREAFAAAELEARVYAYDTAYVILHEAFKDAP